MGDFSCQRKAVRGAPKVERTRGKTGKLLDRRDGLNAGLLDLTPSLTQQGQSESKLVFQKKIRAKAGEKTFLGNETDVVKYKALGNSVLNGTRNAKHCIDSRMTRTIQAQINLEAAKAELKRQTEARDAAEKTRNQSSSAEEAYRALIDATSDAYKPVNQFEKELKKKNKELTGLKEQVAENSKRQSSEPTDEHKAQAASSLERHVAKASPGQNDHTGNMKDHARRVLNDTKHAVTVGTPGGSIEASRQTHLHWTQIEGAAALERSAQGFRAQSTHAAHSENQELQSRIQPLTQEVAQLKVRTGERATQTPGETQSIAHARFRSRPNSRHTVQKMVAIMDPAADLFWRCCVDGSVLKKLHNILDQSDPTVCVNFSQNDFPGRAMFSHNEDSTPGGTVWIKPPSGELTPQLIANYRVELAHEFQHAADYILKRNFRQQHVKQADREKSPAESVAQSDRNRIKSEWNAYAAQAAETLLIYRREIPEEQGPLIGSFSSNESFMDQNSKMFDVTCSYFIQYGLVPREASQAETISKVKKFMEDNIVDITSVIELFNRYLAD